MSAIVAVSLTYHQTENSSGRDQIVVVQTSQPILK
jgi:hypothetical protein